MIEDRHTKKAREWLENTPSIRSQFSLRAIDSLAALLCARESALTRERDALQSQCAALRMALEHAMSWGIELRIADPQWSVIAKSALADTAACAAEHDERLRAECAAIAMFYVPGYTQSSAADDAPGLRTAWEWGCTHAATHIAKRIRALAPPEDSP